MKYPFVCYEKGQQLCFDNIEHRAFDHKDLVRRSCASLIIYEYCPHAGVVFLAFQDRSIEVWEVGTSKLLLTISNKHRRVEEITSLSSCPSAQFLATCFLNSKGKTSTVHLRQLSRYSRSGKLSVDFFTELKVPAHLLSIKIISIKKERFQGNHPSYTVELLLLSTDSRFIIKHVSLGVENISRKNENKSIECSSMVDIFPFRKASLPKFKSELGGSYDFKSSNGSTGGGFGVKYLFLWAQELKKNGTRGNSTCFFHVFPNSVTATEAISNYAYSYIQRDLAKDAKCAVEDVTGRIVSVAAVCEDTIVIMGGPGFGIRIYNCTRKELSLPIAQLEERVLSLKGCNIHYDAKCNSIIYLCGNDGKVIMEEISVYDDRNDPRVQKELENILMYPKLAKNTIPYSLN
mmetsp:Transcript_35946/g.44634  ORF Transcript_35946/g.44634 Transcript_35946/m.44634 type:complete len:404 (+) Transcript_35946:1350-2561(+)